ncbi:diguanylate cyclase domain-containing protein, partial [Vibrio parahaemolyticus]
MAIEDSLTGLANRRCFDERLGEEWARAYRERTTLALLMIDVDHFKSYN